MIYDAVMSSTPRDYQAVVNQLRSLSTSQQVVVDALWDAFCDKGFCWVGFYIDQPGRPDDQRLILGPCRDKPACSPIGLHGVCGQSLTSKQTRIVHDVADLGENYIACDPNDKSEIVIPCFNSDGTCWGVLDVDSQQVGAFNESDERGLLEILEVVGLSH